MRLLTRLTLITMILAPLGGCPAGAPEEPPAGTSLTARALGPVGAEVGETITLTVELEGDVDPARVSYFWFQTYGRSVTIDDPTAAEITFSAPSLSQQQTLRFRVDVSAPGLDTVVSEIKVVISPDTTGGGGSGGGGGGDSGDDEPRPRVEIITNKGRIVVELNRLAAPISVRNFLRYVEEGFYDGTIFHRVIDDFVVQGGGFLPGLERKEPRGPIRNESFNGLRNDRGTIAMARTNDPDSATSQFYFNLVNNNALNFDTNPPGYAVFGTVIEGLSVLDEIGKVETETRDGSQDVPVEDVILERARRISSDSSSGSDGDNGIINNDGRNTTGGGGRGTRSNSSLDDLVRVTGG